jgi:hypothetical protein
MDVWPRPLVCWQLKKEQKKKWWECKEKKANRQKRSGG